MKKFIVHIQSYKQVEIYFNNWAFLSIKQGGQKVWGYQSFVTYQIIITELPRLEDIIIENTYQFSATLRVHVYVGATDV